MSPTPWLRVEKFKVSPEPPRWSWLRGPTQWTQTATMSKTVSLTERFNAELRFQASSPFNHPIFNNPAANLASPPLSA